MRSRLVAVRPLQQVPLSELVGRTLASHVVAKSGIPPSSNAAVDGFAIRLPDGVDRLPDTMRLPVAGRAAAGHPFAGLHEPGTAIRILTGAIVPAGSDAIVMQEDCEPDDEYVVVPAGVRRGANIRRAGEDVQAGDQIFSAGHRVQVQDLASLASLGLEYGSVFARPRVMVFSTGDELVAPGTLQLSPGQIYEANSAMLAELVRAAGAFARTGGTLRDRPEAVREALSEAARENDVILTSGGASMGSEDHVAAALAALGKRHHWQINIKPGRPIMFGQIGDTVVIGLPGNPVAAFVCSLLYVWPTLRVLGGGPWPELVRVPLRAGFDFVGRKTGRREYWRAWIETDQDGQVVAQKFARDGSGLISGLRAATGLIEVEEDHGDVRRGDMVSFIPFAQYGGAFQL